MNLYDFLESKTSKDKDPEIDVKKPVEPVKEDGLNESIQNIILEKTGSKCIIKKKKIGLVVSISKVVTEADVRAILPSIEALSGVKKITSWNVPADEKGKTEIIVEVVQ